MRTLRYYIPELDGSEFTESKAHSLLNEEVRYVYSLNDELNWRSWPGSHKNVYLWVELMNGKCVGFNENPGKGYSFPIVNRR